VPVPNAMNEDYWKTGRPLPPPWRMMEFVGGPLDGESPVHQEMNTTLFIQGDSTGSYQYSGGKYYWIEAQQKPGSQEASA
jgi:hypothetical protein